MMITEDGLVKEDATVEITAFEYANLIRKAEHYKNIVRAAIEGATIPVWSNEPRLNMDAVEEYLQVAEFDPVTKKFTELLKAKAQEEKPEEEQS